MSVVRRPLPVAALALACLALFDPAPAEGQGSGGPCGVGEPVPPSCARARAALQGARAGLGLAAAGGASFPGTNSTLGKRIGSMPRIGLAVSGGLARAPLPELGSAGGSDDRSVLSLRAVADVNLLQGFSPGPTVGGILSADLFGDISFLSPTGDGRYGDGVVGGGVGLRIGVLRESFSLPGVTVSVARRWIGDAGIGAADSGGGADLSTTATSLRGVVGKELFALGFLGGVGWDRYGGDGTVRADDAQSASDDREADRFLLFGGVTYSHLVWQFGLEAGWADAPDVDLLDGDLETDDGALFGSLSIRLIL